MKPEFWLERWKQNRIGFHRADVNPILTRYIDRLAMTAGDTILVPLCGKSLDMLWLSRKGFRVLGVELSELAVEAFFDENNLEVERSKGGPFTRYRSGTIEILRGDIFDLRPELTAGVRAVYDRAALIALPPEMRRRYADHLAAILPAGSRLLLVSIDYPADSFTGPPFSVPEPEIRELFAPAFSIELLESIDALEENPRFKERGAGSLTEEVYLLGRG